MPKSKYKKIYGKELLDHMKEGYSLESFCAVIDVSPKTLNVWAHKYPEFRDYVELAQSYNVAFYEKQLISLAKDGHFGAIKLALERLSPNQWKDKKTLKVENISPETYEIDTGINLIEEEDLSDGI